MLEYGQNLAQIYQNKLATVKSADKYNEMLIIMVDISLARDL